MTLQEYQEASCSLYGEFPAEFGSFYSSLGIIKSVGNLSEALMKILEKPNAAVTIEERKYLGMLLGDIMTHVSLTANCIGMTLEDVGEIGISKLTAERKREQIQNNDIFRKN